MEKIINYTLEFLFPKCHPGHKDFYGRMLIQEDLTELLPYINGYLGNSIEKPKYCPNISWIKFSFKGYPHIKDIKKQVAIKKNEVLMTSFTDENEARILCDETIAFLNYIIYNKNEITPSYREWNPPKPLDIYTKLKKNNCKKCGYPTCMSFAMNIIQELARLEDCPYLADDKKTLNELNRLFN